MDLQILFQELAAVFDGPQTIEKHAQDALLSADHETQKAYEPIALPQPFLDEMAKADAHRDNRKSW
ncbi:MAG: hypothetical protein ACI9ZD_002709 [Paracoccaceae bacterium]|jgi:hypothetical protein